MKYIVAYDTLCQGWQCTKDEHDKPALFDTEIEAYKEILDGATSYFQANSGEEECEITAEENEVMLRLLREGTLDEIKSFIDENPHCNGYDEFVVPEDQYIEGYKTIFTVPMNHV